MGSSRLPGKSMMKLAGQPLVLHVIERVKAIPQVDIVVLATSINDRDTMLESVARKSGIECWRGSEHDVLGRYADAAHRYDANAVMRVTGDCPLLATDVAAVTAMAFLAGNQQGNRLWIM